MYSGVETHRPCVYSFSQWVASGSVSLSDSGCAFVTFNTRNAAVEAQKNLHEKKTLPGVSEWVWSLVMGVAMIIIPP